MKYLLLFSNMSLLTLYKYSLTLPMKGDLSSWTKDSQNPKEAKKTPTGIAQEFSNGAPSPVLSGAVSGKTNNPPIWNFSVAFYLLQYMIGSFLPG